ncbi:MAG: hypothetical protein M3321_10335 [Actinomycetota bacterium]|nr:hypothetical protein [Actinomycetota bacterium]
MADPEQREQESRESDVTKFQEAREADEDERAAAAEEIRQEPQLRPQDDDSP